MDYERPAERTPPTGELCEAQLQRGFSRLRFAPPLEQNYRRAVMAEADRPVLIITISAILVWTGFTILDFWRLNLWSGRPLPGDIMALLAMRWGMLLVLLACLVPRVRSREVLDWKAFSVYLLLCAAAAFTSAIYKGNDIPAANTAQIVLGMAAFMPMGMRFYQALVASLGLVVLTILATVTLLPRDLWGDQGLLIAVILMGVPVAAVGAYLREYAHRRQFLLAAILEHQAQFDPLTDLANRRLFYRHAAAALTHAIRTGEQVTLAVIDIDHFKAFNDRYGHVAGDEALRRVAEAIGDAARRPMDMAARLGGEEFALLLYATDAEQAAPIFERVRQSVDALVFERGGRLTVSLGATALAGEESLDRVYARADQLLYRSKTEGRNQLTMG